MRPPVSERNKASRISRSRRLTEMHGGSVKAESLGMGAGSTFTVRIPLARGRTVVAHRKGTRDAVAIEPAPHGLRVLVVDDNLDGVNMLSMLIGMYGHETELAHNGFDALKKVAAFEPQVVFLDIGLPGLDGYEVARRMRAQQGGRRTTLVSLTGWGSDDDKKRSREAGFDLHLTKPVNAVEVERYLNGLLRVSTANSKIGFVEQLSRRR